MAVLKGLTEESYADYIRKRRASRPMHKDGVDTAVMGWREALSVPYWIHKAMVRGGKNNPWAWVFEPGKTLNENTAKFAKMFPEFKVNNFDELAEARRQKWREENDYKFDTFEKAQKYLSDRLKDRKAGIIT